MAIPITIFRKAFLDAIASRETNCRNSVRLPFSNERQSDNLPNELSNLSLGKLQLKLTLDVRIPESSYWLNTELSNIPLFMFNGTVSLLLFDKTHYCLVFRRNLASYEVFIFGFTLRGISGKHMRNGISDISHVAFVKKILRLADLWLRYKTCPGMREYYH